MGIFTIALPPVRLPSIATLVSQPGAFDAETAIFRRTLVQHHGGNVQRIRPPGIRSRSGTSNVTEVVVSVSGCSISIAGSEKSSIAACASYSPKSE